MSAGVVQLIAIGAQDKYIMGNPEISFFSSTFKRHANFSQSVEKQTIHGAVKNNSMSSIQFERSGDLLSYVYFTLDDKTQALDIQRWDTIIDKVELLIGGSVIDTQDAIIGNPLYEVASLIDDVRIKIPKSLQNSLLKYYFFKSQLKNKNQRETHNSQLTSKADAYFISPGNWQLDL